MSSLCGDKTEFRALLCVPLRLFTPRLPLADAAGDFIPDENGRPLRPGGEEKRRDQGPREKSEAEIPELVKKLGMGTDSTRRTKQKRTTPRPVDGWGSFVIPASAGYRKGRMSAL